MSAAELEVIGKWWSELPRALRPSCGPIGKKGFEKRRKNQRGMGK